VGVCGVVVRPQEVRAAGGLDAGGDVVAVAVQAVYEDLDGGDGRDVVAVCGLEVEQPRLAGAHLEQQPRSGPHGRGS
jgi:hypothetical protein